MVDAYEMFVEKNCYLELTFSWSLGQLNPFPYSFSRCIYIYIYLFIISFLWMVFQGILIFAFCFPVVTRHHAIGVVPSGSPVGPRCFSPRWWTPVHSPQVKSCSNPSVWTMKSGQPPLSSVTLATHWGKQGESFFQVVRTPGRNTPGRSVSGTY